MQSSRAITLLSLMAMLLINRRSAERPIVALIFLIALMPGLAWACSCGCSVFDVGTPSLIPKGSGGTVWLEYDFMNQYINWHGSSPSSAGNNDDKQIKTNFQTAGAQYMFNRNWGAMLTVPYTIRTFRTLGDSGLVNQYNHANFGDVRIWGMYTGLQEDMSLGLLAGFKLPTGTMSITTLIVIPRSDRAAPTY